VATTLLVARLTQGLLHVNLAVSNHTRVLDHCASNQSWRCRRAGSDGYLYRLHLQYQLDPIIQRLPI